MIAIDTNIIVRFLVRDDETQAEAVYRRLKRAEADRESFFVPLVVLLETIWVLTSAYGKSRNEVLDCIEDMRRMPVFEFEKDGVVAKLLIDGRNSRADLPDILIARSAEANGGETGITFDKGAAKLPFFELLR
ncbi:MAG: type II toxin-antitoxin system VapC family toxin [Lentisphaeria bacterium]|nr:type II toxin-antitoxin system VapC family toxin [Lentisphaeria bacterium]